MVGAFLSECHNVQVSMKCASRGEWHWGTQMSYERNPGCLGYINKPLRGTIYNIYITGYILECPWKLGSMVSKLVYFTYLGDVSNLLI